MQKLLVLFVAGLLGLLAFFLITSQPLSDSLQIVSDDINTKTADVQSDHSHDDEHEAGHGQLEVSGMSESETVYRLGGAYVDSYELINEEFGTVVSVTVDGINRIMQANALANHEVGDFPRTGNPNTISAQDNTYIFPLDPTYLGIPQFAREPGIAINGVKFEPQTAERVICESGEVYSIEAVQDILNLGLDFNNAHVQPTGAYHYHAVADNLVEVFDTGEDLIHVGFAKDGFLMYYSKSSAFIPSYGLSGDYRSGTECMYTSPGVSIDEDFEGTKPNGTYVSDWMYTQGAGDLDECNGVEINGQYAYVVTDEYPYIPRCLMGEFTEERPGGGGQGGGRPPAPPR
jgi:hypothetical protein